MRFFSYSLNLCLLLSIFCVQAQYNGGVGGGHNSIVLSIVALNGDDASGIYNGGSGDGFAGIFGTSVLLDGNAQILFNGGNGDGFSVLNRLNLLMNGSSSIVFAGGNEDGFGQSINLNVFLSGSDPSLAFNGGNGDGFTRLTLVNSLLGTTNPSFLFNGGNSDGFDNASAQNILLNPNGASFLFSGGNEDGHSQNINTNQFLGGNSGSLIFTGNAGDGFDDQKLLNSLLDVDNITFLFSGGNADGFDDISAENILLTGNDPALIYNGGNADGADATSISNLFFGGTSSSIVFSGGEADGYGLILENIRTLNGSHRVGSGTNLAYNGTNQYISIGDDSSLDITDGTIEFWFKPDWVPGSLGGTNPMVVGKRTTGTTQYSIHVTDNLDAIGLHDGTTFGSISTTFEQGEWYHIAFVDGGSDTDVIVNGINLGTTGNGFTSNTGAPFNIGSNDGNSEFFTGEIDEVRVWDTNLSLTRIRDWMNVKLTSSHPNYANLVGYWRFDEGSGSTTKNWAEGSNGILNNTPTWTNSGAMIGDQSTHSYISPTTLSLNVLGAGQLTVDIVGGTADGIQIYYIGESPSDASPPANFNNLDNKYFGVFMTGANPFYVITYDYSGNTQVSSESNIQLAYRANNSESWVNLGGIVDQSANTITQGGLQGTEFILGGTTDPLPIQLISFNADVKPNGVILNWKTASELNNYYFILARSLNGTNFEDITLVEGNGNSNKEISYQFIDSNAAFGINFYRLTQVDFDGTETIVGTIAIDFKYLKNQIDIYPNPAPDQLFIAMPDRKPSVLTFELRDLQGKVYLFKPNHKIGSLYSFSVNHLKNGIYLLTITTSKEVYHHKLLIENR
ncbi:LamG-like jellyroll fold domain-containing protein [Ekhidna sp.]|uniref:LamG-like jellyroll fold domain-containing protein n=1 Tax=Ekhidna sp. TaxID=2608089 RepID=UPI003B50B08B